MSQSLDEVYLHWLYSTIGPRSLRNPARTYWQLAEQLHNTVFRSFVHNDNNRISDGQELRVTFGQEHRRLTIKEDWLTQPASVLEVLIALAERTAFNSYSDPQAWLHVFFRNLELDRYTDDIYSDGVFMDVADILDKLVRRKYGVDGRGGIFPLRLPAPDQRKVEIWYQMSTYLLEGEHVANGP